jgi:hypothetical protein
MMMPRKTGRNPLRLRRYLCNHCERVNITEKYGAGVARCAFCGAGWMDLFPWGRIARKNGYPLTPDHGARFSLYLEKPAPE